MLLVDVFDETQCCVAVVAFVKVLNVDRTCVRGLRSGGGGGSKVKAT